MLTNIRTGKHRPVHSSRSNVACFALTTDGGVLDPCSLIGTDHFTQRANLLRPVLSKRASLRPLSFEMLEVKKGSAGRASTLKWAKDETPIPNHRRPCSLLLVSFWRLLIGSSVLFQTFPRILSVTDSLLLNFWTHFFLPSFLPSLIYPCSAFITHFAFTLSAALW